MHLPHTGHVPPPELVAAWHALDILTAPEKLPWWAAHWLAAGADGEALRHLAGLDESDPITNRELLPAALADAGTALPDQHAALSLALADLARLHLEGHLSAPALIAAVEHFWIAEFPVDDFPLGDLPSCDCEWNGSWGRTKEELTNLAHASSVRQLEASSPRVETWGRRSQDGPEARR